MAKICGRKVVRKKGGKFHHEICCAPKCSTAEGFMDEVDCYALMLLSNFHMNCLMIWHLGWAEGVALLEWPIAEGRVALGVLEPSQMFLNWKPRAIGGTFRLS